jgi:hypothetical protein
MINTGSPALLKTLAELGASLESGDWLIPEGKSVAFEVRIHEHEDREGNTWTTVELQDDWCKSYPSYDWDSAERFVHISGLAMEQLQTSAAKYTKKEECKMKGYTKVWEGSGKESLIATKPWMSFIGTTAAEVTDTTNGDFALYVANEFIDWQHYRQTEEYISCYGQSQINPTRGN